MLFTAAQSGEENKQLDRVINEDNDSELFPNTANSQTTM